MPESRLLAFEAPDGPALTEPFHAVGMFFDPGADGSQYIRSMQASSCLARKLSVDGVLVGGGQLIIGKVPEVADLGFWVHPGQQRRGHGQAIAQGLVALGFLELKLHRIAARTSSRNRASHRTLLGAGLQLEGELREALQQDGERFDELHFGLLARDWRARPQPPGPQ